MKYGQDKYQCGESQNSYKYKWTITDSQIFSESKHITLNIFKRIGPSGVNNTFTN
jgi:hypothetical protein